MIKNRFQREKDRFELFLWITWTFVKERNVSARDKCRLPDPRLRALSGPGASAEASSLSLAPEPRVPVGFGFGFGRSRMSRTEKPVLAALPEDMTRAAGGDGTDSEPERCSVRCSPLKRSRQRTVPVHELHARAHRR